MRTPAALLALVFTGLSALPAGEALLATIPVTGQSQTAPSRNKPAPPGVTPVAGPSWLHRLNIPYGGTNLGRGAGRYGPGANEPAVPGTGLRSIEARNDVALSGADLYRLNCQACHTAEGTGAPPEIRSALDLIRGSSLALVRQQFEQEGIAATGADVRAAVAKARDDLYRRIREGGQRMPAHPHLETADIEVLYAYLRELARTPDAPRPSQRTVSWARLGEHVIKGTCHICHDASGPRPTAEEMAKGVIPPLDVIRAANSQAVFVWKAKNGAQLVAGQPSFHYRGRMPVFYYLREEELAAAYDFLVAYPPLRAAAQ